MDSPPLGPDKGRPKRWAKRCEQCCWTFVTRLPLVVVYGLTTWAVWVEADLSLHWAETSPKGYLMLFIGVALYALLNWSYTTCAFTDPGSPLNSPSGSRPQYSHLPTDEPSHMDLPSLTVKSSGGSRYCKKCQSKKPDRAHHCSTCRRCVLKMDHHCPWLATCVGLRNYKAFILFLTYTTLFCWTCFGVSLIFVWTELASEDFVRGGGMLGINMVLLAVIAGIIGLVLTGFTGWHISLAMRNQTTIECLEKTRYSSPIKKTLQRASQMGNGEDAGLIQRYGQQLAEIHANAIPGVTRVEEGEEHPSPSPDIEGQMTAMEALRMNYNEAERQRERARYEDYLDEKDSEKLPNAFDLGWRRNLGNLFGDKPLFWFLPICNTLGDGWHWEPSPKWLTAREAVRMSREEQWREQEQREQNAAWNAGPRSASQEAFNDQGPRRPLTKADRVLGRHAEQYADEGFNPRPGSEMSMKTFKRYDDDTSSIDGLYENEDAFDESSDEAAPRPIHGKGKRDQGRDEWRDWE